MVLLGVCWHHSGEAAGELPAGLSDGPHLAEAAVMDETPQRDEDAEGQG